MLAKTMERKYDEIAARGKAEGKAEAIIRVLSARFKPVDAGLEQSIRAISDLARLDDLVTHSGTCVSLEEFAGYLQEHE